jgi:hypothetical protein
MSQELQTVFHVIIKINNCVKYSPLRGRNFLTVQTEHMGLLHCCAEILHKTFDFIEEITIDFSDSCDDDDRMTISFIH